MSCYPNLTLSKVKIQQEEDSLPREKTLDVVGDQLFPNIDHLIL